MTVSRSRRARAARRRKRRMESVAHDLSREQWISLQEAWGGCAYCGVTGKPLQRDCVLALSRGGRYTLENIVPACRSCNTSKCNEEVTRWMRRKRLDEGSFLLRYFQVKAALAVPSATERPAWEAESIPAHQPSAVDAHALGWERKVAWFEAAAADVAAGIRGGRGAGGLLYSL